MERTVENNIELGDLLCILRDMNITTKFYLVGKCVSVKPQTAKEYLEELPILNEEILLRTLVACDNVDGKIYLTVE